MNSLLYAKKITFLVEISQVQYYIFATFFSDYCHYCSDSCDNHTDCHIYNFSTHSLFLTFLYIPLYYCIFEAICTFRNIRLFQRYCAS